MTTLQTIINDLFVVGATAASIFIKNPASQVHAASIINVLQNLVTYLEGQSNAPKAS